MKSDKMEKVMVNGDDDFDAAWARICRDYIGGDGTWTPEQLIQELKDLPHDLLAKVAAAAIFNCYCEAQGNGGRYLDATSSENLA